jgi:hypothetical protein
MAYAIVGGLFVTTLLTLLFLPALYVAWFRIKEPRKEPEPHLARVCPLPPSRGYAPCGSRKNRIRVRVLGGVPTKGAQSLGREVGRDDDFAGIHPRQDAEF